MAETADSHLYDGIPFYDDTLNFFLKGVDFYLELLKAELECLRADPDINEILDEERLNSLRLNSETQRIERLREWLRGQLTSGIGMLQISHGTVRFLKSTSLLYLQRLKQRRNLIASRPNISRSTLGALDIRISELEEKTRRGVFAAATPIPLLVDQILASDQPQSTVAAATDLAIVSRPKPIVIDSIQVLDEELRARCLDLYSAFCSEGTTERLDTVVSEATRILENRIRRLTGLPADCVGLELASRAFSGSSPLLRISDLQNEQDAGHLLYRGVFGFIRNHVQHQLVAGLLPERVLQVLSLIDYLLLLVNEATRAEQVQSTNI